MASSFPQDFSNFELEITNRCNLACPRCARTDMIERFPKAWKHNDLSLDAFIKFITPVLDQINIFEFKGTMGDPIFHPQFIKWVSWCKAQGKNVYIHTNGQAGKSIWNKLSSLLTPNDKVVVGIDGTPDNFMQYRINAKWKNIEEVVKALKHKTHLVWQYIIFSYNETNIEEARELSRDYGFDEFLLVNSDRWIDNADWLKPSEGRDRPVTDKTNDISPDCLSRPMHIVTADGYYMPCCYLVDHRWRFKTPWARQFNINDCTINDIIKSSSSNEFYAKLTNETAPDYCRFCCGKCN